MEQVHKLDDAMRRLPAAAQFGLEFRARMPIHRAYRIRKPTMYNSVNARAANAYRRVGVETHVDGATPHQLISLLFDGLAQTLAAAQGALTRGDLQAKGQQIGRAVRLLEEGLKGGLDQERGGELAMTLCGLYDYCIGRLTQANLRNDAGALAEVAALMAPVAQGWKQIAPVAAGSAP